MKGGGPWQRSGVYIIAEAGVNHNGNLALARRLVEVAAQVGSDCVKFQTFKPAALTTGYAPQADYQAANTGRAESQLAMLERLALDAGQHRELQSQAHAARIDFASTAFDWESLQLLDALDVPFLKVPSGEVTNLPFLRQIASLKRPLVVSTGMCTLGEVEQALTALVQAGASLDRTILLHCTSEYPAPPGDVHLRAMLTLRDAFGTRVGYSDHTLGIEVALAAVALGAIVIEKHFTVDRSLAGPDHAASLLPGELAAMVAGIRKIEEALGVPQKQPSQAERQTARVARKSLVARRRIAAGERFGEDNLTAKRPGTGISPMLWDDVLGRSALRTFEADEMIEL